MLNSYEQKFDLFSNKFIQDEIRAGKRLKNKSQKCVYPGCNRKAISSHTFSKENSLRSIAKEGKVMTFKPKSSDRKKNLEPTPVGIDNVSTFYGFCKEHDQLFTNIDHGIIKTKYDIALHMFRCIAKRVTVELRMDGLMNEHGQQIYDTQRELLKEFGVEETERQYDNNYNSGTNELEASCII